MPKFKCPREADSISKKAIKNFQATLGHTGMSQNEADEIVARIMKAQEPRDTMKLEQMEEWRRAILANQRAERGLPPPQFP